MRWALVRVSVAVTTMVALAFLVPLGLMVRETARDRAYAEAERQAAAIGPALAITTDAASLQRAVASTEDGSNGLAVHIPASATGTGRPVDIGRPRAGAEQVAAAERTGDSVRVPVHGGLAYLQPIAVGGGGVAVIEVFIPDAALTQGVVTAWVVLTAVALALVLISVAVADRLGTRIVGSARRLSDAARALGEGDLAVRVPEEEPGTPPELRDAAGAFNSMAGRVVELLAAERELAADLSHRLRTPLTVLRLNAASLGGGVAAEQTRHAVEQLEGEVDRIIRTARERSRSLAGLNGAARGDGRGAGTAATGAGARLAPGTGAGMGPSRVPAGRCDAAEVIRERAGFWSALAEDEGRRWHLAGADRPCTVPVPASELTAALDALLGNVFRHTPVGTAYAVDVHPTDDGVIVLVSDAGPGIPDPEAALRRGHGAGGAGSTGLGLDIVRRVAESTGGEVGVGRSVLGGAEVRMRLQTARKPGLSPRRARRAPRRVRRRAPRLSPKGE